MIASLFATTALQVRIKTSPRNHKWGDIRKGLAEHSLAARRKNLKNTVETISPLAISLDFWIFQVKENSL
jgi:hypothetical protein